MGLVVDVVLALVAASVGSALEIADPDPATKWIAAPTWVYVTAQVAAAAMLLIRRRQPYAAALTIAAISLIAPAWAAVLIPYSVTAYGGRRRWAVVAALAAAFLLGAHAWAIADPISAPAVIGLSALLGMYTRARRSLIAELTARAEHAADQARTDERIRLAGEMHDVVTHRINLMVLQAGALRVSTTDPAARVAAEELRVAGCQALAELRDLVGVLRDDAASPAAVAETDGEPGLESLVSDSRAVGLPVRLEEDGDPTPVAPTVRRTLFRVVQESLTNVRKHAPGADATVSVRYGTHDLHATVSNTPRRRPPDTDLTGMSGGSGLEGLKHRVEVVGGTLIAEPTPDGGFTVSTTLPVYVPTAARR